MKKFIPGLALLMLLFSGCRHQRRIDLEDRPQKPEIFAEGTVSTPLYERDMAISPDGNEVVFSLSDSRQARRILVKIERNGKEWSKKEILNISGRYDDIEPFFADQGKSLYFVSNRPVIGDSARKDYNIWVSERNGETWNEPVMLPSNINTPGNEFYPAVAKNGNIYFTAEKENAVGLEDIFISRYDNGKYADPMPLDTNVNSKTYEFNAYVNPGENLIVFSSYGRKDDLGGGDLYYSNKDSCGKWLPAKHMEKGINSEGLDYCPFIDWDRSTFYFTSDRRGKMPSHFIHPSQIDSFANSMLNGNGNIYRVDWHKAFTE
jgi:hypothetical protein